MAAVSSVEPSPFAPKLDTSIAPAGALVVADCAPGDPVGEPLCDVLLDPLLGVLVLLALGVLEVCVLPVDAGVVVVEAGCELVAVPPSPAPLPLEPPPPVLGCRRRSFLA